MAKQFFYGKEIAYSEDMLDFIMSKQEEELADCIEDTTESAKDLQEIYNLLEFNVMSEKQYIVTKLIEWGLTYTEIGELMDISPNAVGLQLMRARQKKEKINQLLKGYIEVEEKIQDIKIKFYNRPLKSDLE